MQHKILALCSGGFDSVLMLNIIRYNNPDSEIHTLFFDYGQKNHVQERACAVKVSEKLHCTFHEIDLPSFSWTSSEFYTDGFSGDKEYLEMRNMVFISYALSMCESLGLNELHMATLKSRGYYDTSEDFLGKIRSIAQDKGIMFETPFSEFEKQDLAIFAFRSGIKDDDFFTCDNPVDGKPCGKCPDCEIIKEIMDHAHLNTPAKVWSKTADPFNPEFQRLLRESPIEELRVMVNNDCQLHCKHCYYGFTHMKKPRLSLEEFRDVFKQATELGIDNFHFSGKEPMYDSFIFDLARVVKEVNPKADCTVVTNGITVPKFAKDLKKCGFSKVFLSVDDVGGTSLIRSVHGVTDAALKALNKVKIPVEVFIDIHENNYDKVDVIMDYLYNEYGVKEFYIRTISIIGSAKNMTPLDYKQLNVTYDLLYKYLSDHEDIRANFTIFAPYVYSILYGEGFQTPLGYAIDDVISFASRSILNNFTIFPQTYCGKYESQITITPDGYLHGCASEMSVHDYDKISPGNVRDASLAQLIKEGKEKCIRCNCKEVDENGNLKFFTCTCCNPID